MKISCVGPKEAESWVGHRVARDTDDWLHFEAVVQYDAEAVHQLVQFDEGDMDYYNCMDIFVAKQLFEDNTNNDTSNNDGGEH